MRWWGLLAAAAALAVVAPACGSTKATAAHDTSVFHLKPGSCVVPPTDIKASVSSVKVVPCSAPHTQEVYAEVTDPAKGNYPGLAALRTFADGACLQRFAAYTGVDYRDSSLFYTYLLPSVRSWATDDRTVVCIVTTTGVPLTSSVRASAK
ncbi:MAG TPA: septum formation family protein [Acidimicrobiales bacterium]|nr:septum formation family protein [Acidimicrobiales bacterium]